MSEYEKYSAILKDQINDFYVYNKANKQSYYNNNKAKAKKYYIDNKYNAQQYYIDNKIYFIEKARIYRLKKKDMRFYNKYF